MLTKLRCFVGLTAMAVLASIVLVGCGGSSNDTDKAKIRVLNASLDYDSLDLYVDGERKQAGIAYATVSDYLSVDADTYTIAFKRNGSSSKLQSVSATLAKKSHKTYVGYGRSGSYSTLAIDEDQSEAASGQASLLILNTATDAGAVDVYLTGSSAVLSDATPVVSDLAAGTASSYITASSGTYRLRITAAGSTSDVRLDVSNFTLASKDVRSLVVADSVGGVLVNAMVLTQQGSLVLRNNAQARVRAVVGVSSGTTVTGSINGTTLVTSATAATIGAYKLIDAGADPVTLSVDGSAVTVADQTLTAGADYTLLVWDNSGDTQTTLINDDDRRPLADDGVKLRLVHAMSGLSDPISLAVDLSPVAESVARGQASAFTELTSSTDSRFDVTDASTTGTLFTQTSTSLLAKGVYSMFVFGDASETTGGLRKER